MEAARRQRRWQGAPSERLTTEDGEAEHGLRPSWMLAEGEAEHGLKPSRMLAGMKRMLRWQRDGGPLSRSAGTIRRRARPMQVPAL